MISVKFFPICMIVLSIAAAIVYGLNKDWRHCIYWFAGAVLTSSVTF